MVLQLPHLQVLYSVGVLRAVLEWRAVCVARYLLAQDARHSAGGRIWVFVPVCAAGHWAFAAAEYLSRAGCRWVSATQVAAPQRSTASILVQAADSVVAGTW